MIDFIERLSGRRKQALAMAVDGVMLPAMLATALITRHGQWQLDWWQFWPAFLVTLLAVPMFAKLGLYRHIIRYIGSRALLAIARGVGLLAILLLAVAFMVRLADFPRTIPFLFALLAFLYLTGTRFLVRYYAYAMVRRDQARRPVAVFGTDDQAAYLAHQLARNRQFRPVAFIDDDPHQHGQIIHGLKVYPVAALARLCDEHVLGQVLVVAPSSPQERRRVVELLEPYPVRVSMVLNVEAMLSGETPGAIRDVDVGDLLGRDQVEPLPRLMRRSVSDRTVLVTGAGGSIGTELCRQILPLAPKALIVLDHSEYALLKIEQELRQHGERDNDSQVVAVLGSVLDQALLDQTMQDYSVDTVYHAAAYKHVNVVEKNVIQGIKNNTFGTLRTAEAALKSSVSDFILISTDKAVRTRNVMGASKRLAEMILQASQDRKRGIRFSCVRFGNVLVSSGSVVPFFLEQVDKGGPVTVTHRDATRYFMTLSEAAALVLQAASMARGGDVFLLDMGEPVRILDLAHKIIRLRGYKVRDETTPHGDIEVQFTGLRSGEKLHEELLLGDAPLGTDHPRIMRAVESHVPWPELRDALDSLAKACDSFDYDVIKRIVETLVEGADLAALPVRPSERLPTPDSPMERSSNVVNLAERAN